MKIGFHAGGFIEDPDNYVGASGTNFFPLAYKLAELGHDVFVLQLTRDPPRKTVESDGVTFHFEPTLPKILKNPLSGLKLLGSQFLNSHDDTIPQPYDTIKGEAIRQFVRTRNLDALYLLHNTNVAAYLMKKTEDTKLIINLIGFGIDESQGGSRNTFPYQDYIFERPIWSLHIETTSFLVDKYTDIYDRLSLDTDRLLQLPHCIDTSQFNPDATFEWKQYGIDAETPRIVYPVHVYPGKNIELGIQTLARIQQVSGYEDTKYIIAGNIWDEEYHGMLKNTAAELSIEDSVNFLNGVPHSQMAGFLADSDLVLFPSHQETYGIGIVESLCCGTPVVGPEYIPSTREILRESSGGYPSSKTTDSFSEQAITVLRDNPDRKTIHEEAKKRFGSEHIAEEFVRHVIDSPDEPMSKPTRDQLDEIKWSHLDEITETYDLTH